MGMMVAHTGYRMIYLLGALLVVVAGGVYALQMKGKSGVALVVAKKFINTTRFIKIFRR